MSRVDYVASGRSRRGMVLVVTLIVLVVLVVLVFTMTSRIQSQRRYQQYLIDYQQARYACDSAVKYALAEAGNLELNYIPREGFVDFSDVFALDREELDRLMSDWAMILEDRIENEEAVDTKWIFKEDPYQEKESADPFAMMFNNLMFESSLDDDPNEVDGDSKGGEFDEEFGEEDPLAGLIGAEGDDSIADPNDVLDDMSIDPNNLKIPGPYGPEWPLIQEPYTFEIEDASVEIEIMDENAKMPLTWAIVEDPEIEREAQAAVQTFCEWMQMESWEIDGLIDQLGEVREIKRYEINPKEVTLVEKKGVRSAEKDNKRLTARERLERLRRDRQNRKEKNKAEEGAKKKTRPAIYHQTDFAKLLHSTVVHHEKLDEPIAETGLRIESARKYLGLWGSQRVNVNSAPRHVLEAAFTFSGDPVEIADAIIQERRVKAFESFKDLGDRLFAYSNYFDRAEPFITTQSRYLAIRVTVRKGRAKVSAVATVIKDGAKIQPVAVMYY